MTIEKKYQCVHCGASIECTDGICSTTCSCGKVKVTGGVVVEGRLGIDFVDVSQKLLLG